MNNRKLFNDKEELESSMFNYLKLQQEKQITENKEQKIPDFQNEKLIQKIQLNLPYILKRTI